MMLVSITVYLTIGYILANIYCLKSNITEFKSQKAFLLFLFWPAIALLTIITFLFLRIDEVKKRKEKI